MVNIEKCIREDFKSIQNKALKESSPDRTILQLFSVRHEAVDLFVIYTFSGKKCRWQNDAYNRP